MSSPDIAKIFYCSPEYIRYLLRKYNIKIRTKSEAVSLLIGIKIPKKILKECYLDKKMTIYKIAKKFQCCNRTIYKKLLQYKIPIRSRKEAKSLLKPRYPRKDFKGNLEEKAYLIGLRKGDLHVKTRSEISPTIFVNTNSTKPDLIQIIEQLFSPYGHVWKSKPAKNGAVAIHCFLNRSFSFLLNNTDSINSWILKNSKYFAAFLAGYTDAEGTFCLCNGKGVYSIRSQDKNILRQIRSKLIKLGILLRFPQIVRKEGTKDIKGTKSNKNIWAIYIHRKDALLKLIDLIQPYLKHSEKQRRMKIVKNNILERNKKYNNRQDTFWYKLYLKEGIKI
jgi:hypothetical protein